VGAWAILLRHAGPHLAVVILPLIRTHIGALLGGVVATEAVLAVPGIGALFLQSAITHDDQMLPAITLAMAALLLLIRLIADIGVALLDRRVR
jgi:peptide/nickel transport system permease protein